MRTRLATAIKLADNGKPRFRALMDAEHGEGSTSS